MKTRYESCAAFVAISVFPFRAELFAQGRLVLNGELTAQRCHYHRAAKQRKCSKCMMCEHAFIHGNSQRNLSDRDKSLLYKSACQRIFPLSYHPEMKCDTLEMKPQVHLVIILVMNLRKNEIERWSGILLIGHWKTRK